MKHKKVKFILGSFLIVLAIGFLISTSVSNNSKFFLTVDELASSLNEHKGDGLKVKGKVVNGSISRDPDNYLRVSFNIEEKNATLPVFYKGVTPDMFEDGREVVVEGTVGDDGVFHANTLLTSCPSKYEAEKEAGKTHPGSIPLGEKKQDMPKLDLKNSGSPKATI